MTKQYHWNVLPTVAYVQGAYYVITGIWPLVDMSSFELVTGPKVDDWLVQTVGLLVLVCGIVLLMAAWRRQFTAEVVVLAVGTAVSLAMVDVVFVALGRIGPVYLADAVAEIILVSGWVAGLLLARCKTTKQ
jgi:hypothetical protein